MDLPITIVSEQLSPPRDVQSLSVSIWPEYLPSRVHLCNSVSQSSLNRTRPFPPISPPRGNKRFFRPGERNPITPSFSKFLRANSSYLKEIRVHRDVENPWRPRDYSRGYTNGSHDAGQKYIYSHVASPRPRASPPPRSYFPTATPQLRLGRPQNVSSPSLYSPG